MRGDVLILLPRLPDDLASARRANVHALWRLGRNGDRFVYAPILVKHHEVVEPASSRRILESAVTNLSLLDAQFREGVGPRSTSSVTRSGLGLAHATRVLQQLGHGDPGGRSGLVDRSSQVWWFDLASTEVPRFNLSLYDEAWRVRLDVVRAHDAWRQRGDEYPTVPYWHRECEECPYQSHCHEELEGVDDVSLTRYSSLEQQKILRSHGVTTRRELASLDPQRIHHPLASGELGASRENSLGTAIERLADLIYRARVTTSGSYLRILDADDVGCPVADVEVDVDMESYDDRTYLWGATVRVRSSVPGVEAQTLSFVTWEPLTDESEARVFQSFWAWFHQLRVRTLDAGHSFAAYCFWAHAEDGAINRALDTLSKDGAIAREVRDFRAAQPSQWVDLHQHAKRSIQTDGPLGLKSLARAAGFNWRDTNPSGEASMRWYEIAISDGPEAMVSRQRILDYNEDDCRATAALRDWLNGPAKRLPHRDSPQVMPPRSLG